MDTSITSPFSWCECIHVTVIYLLFLQSLSSACSGNCVIQRNQNRLSLDHSPLWVRANAFWSFHSCKFYCLRMDGSIRDQNAPGKIGMTSPAGCTHTKVAQWLTKAQRSSNDQVEWLHVWPWLVPPWYGPSRTIWHCCWLRYFGSP